MGHLRTVFNTAYYEWKIQIHQRSTCVVAGLFFLVAWWSFDYAKLPISSAIRLALGTAQGLGLFGGLFIAIIGTSVFLREFKPEYDVLWTRSFSIYAYILGKFLGICLVVATALLPVGLWVAGLMVNLHGIQSILYQVKEWTVILAPTLVFILAITFLVGFLFRRPLWTSLIMILFTVGILAMNLNVTHLLGFAPYGVYVSPLIGYGPDSRLVTLHQVFYLELSVLSLLIVLLMAHLQAPRQEKKISPVWKLILSALAVGMLLVSIHTASNFQIESKQLSENPPVNSLEAETMECSFLRSYQIQLELNQKTESLSGEVVFHMQPDATSMQIPIRLNSGLIISKIKTTPPGIEAEVVGNTLMLAFPQELNGQDVSLSLAYSGNIRAPRYSYDNLYLSPELSVAPFLPGGYMDGETAFLVRDGNWHPFSWCAPDQLSIAWLGAPASGIVQTADRIESSPDHTMLVWDQQPPHPLFVASQNYETIQIGGGILFAAPDHISDRELEAVYFPYPALLKQVDLFLQEEARPTSQPYQIAIVPLLNYDSYDPSSGVYLIPETRKVTQILVKNNKQPETNLDTPQLLYQRWVATDVLRAWWCSSDPCLQLQADSSFPGQSWISGWEDQPVLDALISYASLRLAEPLVSEEFIDEEIAARQQALADTTFWTGLNLPFVLPSETNNLVVRLHGLWEQTGPELFWQLVREYHQKFGNTSLPEEDFARFVVEVTGTKLP